MKHVLIILILIALQTVFLAQSGPASVDGILVDHLSGAPVSKATLDLQSIDNSSRRYPALTATDGRFTIRNVAPGRYSLTASRSGYVRTQYGQRGPNGSAAILNITEGQQPIDIRMSMVPSGSISGRLTDNEGEPVADAQIHAWKVTYSNGWRMLVPVESQGSNDLGDYRLFGLPPGQYYVTAQPEPRDNIRSPSYAALGPPMAGAVVTTFSAGQGAGTSDPAVDTRKTGKDYSPVYFGGTTDQNAAAIINLSAGADLRNNDILITRVPMLTMAGTLVDSSSLMPVRTARMTVTPVMPNLQFTTTTIVNVTGGKIAVDKGSQPRAVVNGSFSTGMLPQGLYRLTAEADVQGRRLSGQTIVDLHTSNAADMQIVLTPSRDISGQAVIEGRPAGETDLNLSAVRVGLKSTVAPDMDIPPQALAAGRFTLKNVTAGDFVFNISGLSNGYVKAIQLGTMDLLNDGLNTANLPDGEIRMVLGTNPGSVHGFVRDDNGQPLSGITVVLVPEESRRHRIDLFQNMSTDSAGAYHFERIPPGQYALYAWEDVENDAWRNPAFMRVQEGRGMPVTIGDGAAAAHDLPVVKY